MACVCFFLIKLSVHICFLWQRSFFKSHYFDVLMWFFWLFNILRITSWCNIIWHSTLCLYLTRSDTCQGYWEVPHLPVTLRFPNTSSGTLLSGAACCCDGRSSFDLCLHPGLFFYAGQGARVTVKWLDCLRPIVLRPLWIRMQMFSQTLRWLQNDSPCFRYCEKRQAFLFGLGILH